jgi:hypothetical protein
MAQACRDDLPDKHSGIFFERGLDRNLLICPSGNPIGCGDDEPRVLVASQTGITGYAGGGNEIERRCRDSVNCASQRRRGIAIDHIIPRSKGGQPTWENVVAACSPRNLRKGNLTPQQARMFPRRPPFCADGASTASQRPAVPTELSARQLAGLFILGYRVRPVGSGQRLCRGS